PRVSPYQFASARSAAATPRSRFDPERLWMGSHPAARAMSASIRAVVVLPFVPETQTTPCLKPDERAVMKFGSTVSATSPGRAVPPRPVTRRPSRVSLPAALAMRASVSGTFEAYRRYTLAG